MPAPNALLERVIYFSNSQKDMLNLHFRQCYFRVQKVMNGGLGRFLDELNTSFGSGVLTSDLEPVEFKNFLKWLMKNYFR